MIAIVDYGMGNLASIKNMFKKIGAVAEIVSTGDQVMMASKIILPGVGAFDNAMDNISKLNLLPALEQKAKIEKVPVLGICLGMQILLASSQEGSLPGLGWVDGIVKRFKFEDASQNLKVPHMGWNSVNVRNEETLFKDLRDSKFYFVHSYFVHCNNESDVLATTNYGISIVSALKKDNIYGTQFHPEKSHRFGMQLLRNFIQLAN